MNIIIKALIYCTFLLLLYGCNDLSKTRNDNIFKEEAYGNWYISVAKANTHTKAIHENEVREQMIAKDLLGKRFIDLGYMLNISKDNSFMLIRYESSERGEWSFEDGILTINSDTIEIKKILEYELGERKIICTLKSDGITYESILSSYLEDFEAETLNPYHWSNNKWRNPPKVKENVEELRIRLVSYIKHIALIFRSTSQSEKDVLSLQYSPGILKIYRGGIGIKPEEKIPKEWITYFYDEIDMMNAYYLLDVYLDEEILIERKSTDNWRLQNYNLLIDLADRIERKSKSEAEIDLIERFFI